MIFRKALLMLAFAAVSSLAMAQTYTREEEAACRPDVRKFCYKIPQNAGKDAFRACLESNRNILSQKCQMVFMAHKH